MVIKRGNRSEILDSQCDFLRKISSVYKDGSLSLGLEKPISYPKVKVAQLCLTLCDPVDYTVPGILQARMLEWVAFPFSRDQIQVSHIAGSFFTSWATREAHLLS